MLKIFIHTKKGEAIAQNLGGVLHVVLKEEHLDLAIGDKSAILLQLQLIIGRINKMRIFQH